MKIDQNRLQRQNLVIQRWTKANRKGTLEAVTGFGKTFVALLIMQEMNSKVLGSTSVVVVPTQNLKSQWEHQIERMGITGAHVVVINTAVKNTYTCDLLILDEIHNYTSEVFGTIFTVVEYRYILGLTATLDDQDDRQYIIDRHAPVIDTVTLPAAIKGGWVSKFHVFNWGLRMNEEEQEKYQKITDAYYKHFAIFNNRFHIAMKCLTEPGYVSVYARNISGWTESEILNSARAFNRAMQARKQLIYKSATKREAAKQLVEVFDVPTITFGESVDSAIQLNKVTQPWSSAYHSKISKHTRQCILENFSDPLSDVRVIHTARALDEGFDVDGIELAIICSGTSKPRQDLQRTGRAIRFKEGKTGVIINLYLLDTQDEKWLRSRQKKSTHPKWVLTLGEILAETGNALLRNPIADTYTSPAIR